MGEGINTRQLIIGSSVLFGGALFYYFFRSAEHTYFLKFLGNSHHLKDFLPPLLAIFENSLPTFIHVVGFTLMTASIIAKQKRGYAAVCLAWFAIDVLFEIGQGIDKMIIQIIPNWFSNFLFLENTRNYFLQGRFDYFDLLSIVLGSIIAYNVLIKTKEEKGERL
jgi:hypothetical protein